MDRNLVTNYGFLLIVSLSMAVLLALATPFGDYIGESYVAYIKMAKKNMDNEINHGYEDNMEYFDDMIGVTKLDSSTLENVKIRVSNNRWPYIETKPLHGSQRVILKNEEGVIIQIQVYLNKELEQLIMSFGADLEVIEPKTLRDALFDNFKKAYANYL